MKEDGLIHKTAAMKNQLLYVIRPFGRGCFTQVGIKHCLYALLRSSLAYTRGCPCRCFRIGTAPRVYVSIMNLVG